MNLKDYINSLPKTEKEIKNKFNSKCTIDFVEDIKENDFLLYEAVTPEQKEAGQREMWKIEQNVINKIDNYFNKKWSKIENLKNKKEEKKRIDDLKKYFKSYEPNEDSIKWFKEKIGTSPKMPISIVDNDKSSNPGGVDGLRLQTTFVKNFNVKNIVGKNRYLNGFDFKGSDLKKVENTIWKFIIMHEQGHLFNYLVQLIETGTVRPVGTAMFNFSENDKKDVNDSESSTNAYAIDNMYRKDRREFLKNFKAENPKELNRLKDAYIKGLDDKSRTY